jgi:hypothetical protein
MTPTSNSLRCIRVPLRENAHAQVHELERVKSEKFGESVAVAQHALGLGV